MKEIPDMAVYVYGFLKTVENEAKTLSCVGIDGEVVDFRPTPGGISAIVGMVKRGDFCGPAGEVNLANVTWLAPRAICHQNVVEEAMRLRPELPARFGTLFSSYESLDSFVERHARTIAEFLDKIKDRQEWAVQCFIDRPACEKAWMERAKDKNAGDRLTAGAAFMREELLRREMKEALDDWIGGRCEEMLDALAPFADESCERRLLPKEKDSDRDMVANWAFLVPAENVADFTSRANKIGDRDAASGLSFALSGPWPVYSFRPNLEDQTRNAEAES